MDFTEVACQKTDAGRLQFLRAVDIWIRNPHVENRRILASEEIVSLEVRTDVNSICQRFNTLSFPCLEVENNDYKANAKVLIDALGIENYSKLNSTVNLANFQCHGLYCRLAKLLPRNVQIFSPGIECAIVDLSSNSVLILHKTIYASKQCLGPSKPYIIKYDNDGSVRINIVNIAKGSKDSSIEWLVHKLFPRFLKWMQHDPKHNTKVSTSLSLLSSEKYAIKYDILKKKYGPEMVTMWPENTDPKKFVYEDIAIATYLILLWEKERNEKNISDMQSFVDLGCGNGLLVHILTGEGHPGTGIDLRKRKIWDLYPRRENLQVSTIVPSSIKLPPDTNWLIGNHSDELTPWIPVIAARTSSNCRFFLLPCCAYEFDGSKYRRYSATKSQYSEYIDYVNDVCEKCGFETEIDRLRIPSTKRICIIGWNNANQREDDAERDARIRELINARATSREVENNIERTDATANSDDLFCNFKARDTVEKVRNCTRIEKSVITEIISIVSTELLRDGRLLTLEEIPGKVWNAGREIDLSEIANSIPRETLSRLRNECGGLQTLLKNHGHIFSVAQGKVTFRMPGVEIARRKRPRNNTAPPRLRVKPCWFVDNHPDGCPRKAENCSFKH